MPAFGLLFAWPFGIEVETDNGIVTVPFGKALPQVRDLALDPLTGGLLIDQGDAVLVADRAAIAQEIHIRLKFMRGSWFLDTLAGLPYFENILIKSPNLAAIRTIFTNEILASSGVRSLLSLKLDLNRQTRELSVTFSVNTDLGQIDSELVL